MRQYTQVGPAFSMFGPVSGPLSGPCGRHPTRRPDRRGALL